ncbi:hypothetical protein SAMN04487820_10840 [Actinopolyspora mzabensis]|uniref:Uncharacterized protein n=1 Tax=Actinopolyspora mzabensis TaxID=995066 RepID=A0A1G9C0P0_ACTMZ|nr:hypothetical protein [Actinopolyspora mzabensis]SDK45256.1 hypothetical protein SAMN04487820_10840 [Actinopolyspora mzabensis]
MTETAGDSGGPETRHGTDTERYKEIVALATGSAERLQELERDRVERLERELAGERDLVEQAEQQQEEVEEGVRLRWNAAMEALWEERWLRVTQLPAPDTTAEPAGAEDAIRSVQRAYLDLYEELEQGRWSAPNWIPTGWISRRER